MIASNGKRKRSRQAGFTLVELLIVVIILGILAAIVVPQFTDTTSEAKDAGLDSMLTNMRTALDMYYQHHGEYPSMLGDGTNAAFSELAFFNQLTLYTTEDGNAQGTKDATHKFGPYMKKPSLPVDPFKDVSTLKVVQDADADSGDLTMGADVADPGGWKYDPKTGKFICNIVAYEDR